MAMVHLTIDGVPVSVEEGTTVLKAAHAAGIKIPTLCWLKDINEIGACRMCVVDVGARSLAAACVMPVSEGMVVKTNTPQVRQARRAVLELILSNHERKCLSCVRSQNCELQDLAKELGVDENRFEGENIHYPLDNFSPSIVRDPNKCILCRRCVAVCRNVQKIGAIGAVNRGFKTVIAPAFGKTMLETDCVFWDALSDPEKFVVVQPAPAVRVALGEEFGLPIGTRVTGKMTQALRRLGFDKVFDTDFGADLTIMDSRHPHVIPQTRHCEHFPVAHVVRVQKHRLLRHCAIGAGRSALAQLQQRQQPVRRRQQRQLRQLRHEEVRIPLCRKNPPIAR